MEHKDLIKRRKMAWIKPQDLIDYFGNWKNRDYIFVREVKDCERATVLNVFFDYPRHLFGIILAREDWPICPDGVEPELVNSGVSDTRLVKIGAYCPGDYDMTHSS